MPRLEYKRDVLTRFTAPERDLLRIMLALVNPLRLRLQLPALTEADLHPLLRQGHQPGRQEST